MSRADERHPHATPEPLPAHDAGPEAAATTGPDGSALVPPGETPAEAAVDARRGGPGVWGLAGSSLLALACGLGGSYVYNRFLARPHNPDAEAVAGRPVVAAPGRPVGSDPAPARPAADRPDVLSSAAPRTPVERIDMLSERLGRLERQAEGQSKAGDPAAEEVRVRLTDLTESTNKLAPLPSRVEQLSGKVNDLSASLRVLRDDVEALKGRPSPSTRPAPVEPIPRADPPPPTTPTPLPDARPGGVPGSPPAPPPPPPAATAASGLARGAGLFRGGNYRAAYEAFRALDPGRPEDARVWYYSALSRGFVTNDWTGEAARLAEKGVALERAGTPKSSEVDAEFKDLTTANGRDWLAAYRKRAKAPR